MRGILGVPEDSVVVDVGGQLGKVEEEIPNIIEVSSLADCPENVDVLFCNSLTRFPVQDLASLFHRIKPKFIITCWPTHYPEISPSELYRDLLSRFGYEIDQRCHHHIREFLNLKVSTLFKAFSAPETLISVCMPTFNSEGEVVETLKSVLSQEGVDFEVVIVDDSSKDSTFKLLQPARKFLPPRCSRLKVIKLPYRQGASVGRNIAWKNSLGEYIAFFDCDDVMPPHFLKELLKTLSEAPEDCAFSYPVWWKLRAGGTSFYKYEPNLHPEWNVDFDGADESFNEMKKVYPNTTSSPLRVVDKDNNSWRKNQPTYPNEYEGGSHFQSSLLVKREVLEKCGGWPEDAPFAQDRAFVGRIKSLGWHAIGSNDTYFVYTMWTKGDSISFLRIGRDKSEAFDVLAREGAIPEELILFSNIDSPSDFGGSFRSRNVRKMFNHTIRWCQSYSKFSELIPESSGFIFVNPVSQQSQQWVSTLKEMGFFVLSDFTTWPPGDLRKFGASHTTVSDEKLLRVIPEAEYVPLHPGSFVPSRYVLRDRGRTKGIGWVGSFFGELEEIAGDLRILCHKYNTHVEIISPSPPPAFPFPYRFTPWEGMDHLECLFKLSRTRVMVVGDGSLSLHKETRLMTGWGLGLPTVEVMSGWQELVELILTDSSARDSYSLEGFHKMGEVISQPLSYARLVHLVLEGARK